MDRRPTDEATVFRSLADVQLAFPDMRAEQVVLSVDNDAWDAMERELVTLEGRKRKKWRGRQLCKAQYVALRWKDGRIVALDQQHYVVSRREFDAAMARYARARLPMSSTGAAVIEGLDHTSAGAARFARIQAEENARLRTGNHTPRVHAVAAPRPGCRLVR